MSKSKLNKPNRLGIRVWSLILIFGLFGQVAWIVENMYFNVFMDRTVTTNPFAVQMMVAMSAIFATAATLFAGVFSDRVGKRKLFMSSGYIVWGLTVMAFALFSVENTSYVFKTDRNASILITVIVIIIMDCIMSIVGSVSNDAAFNAWVTDVTDNTNRGAVEGALAIMPILAMAVMFGGFDAMTADTFRYLDGSTGTVFKEGAALVSHGNWKLFFILLGAITSVTGLAGIFLLKDSKKLMPQKSADFKTILYGFKLKTMKENKELYVTYISMALTGVANMAYMPYLIMYLERTLEYSDYIIPVGIIIVTSSLASVVLGSLYDRFGRHKFVIPGVAVYIAGAVFMTLASPLLFKGKVPMPLMAVAGFILMTGDLAIAAIQTATVRDFTPKDKIGMFQGVRMVFWVLIPMIIGPLITAIITFGSKPVGQDYYGYDIYKYPPYMFAVAAGIMLLNLPLMLKLKSYTKALDEKCKEPAAVNN